jgi:uncharacterized protein YegL
MRVQEGNCFNSLKRTRILWIGNLVVAVFISIIIIACGGRRSPGQIGNSATPIEIPVEAQSFPVDVYLVLDQSGSMLHTDPNYLRIEASRYLVMNVANRGSTRIGVINFGSDATQEIGLTDLQETSSQEKVIEHIVAGNLGETAILKALRIAADNFEHLATFEDNIKPVIILFTDGKPDDDRKLPLNEYFAEIKNDYEALLKPFFCDIYVIGINASGTEWAESKPYWENTIGRNHVFEISRMDQLRLRFNEIVQRVWGIPPSAPDMVGQEGLKITMPPYIDKVEFHAFPETAGVSLVIYRPNGLSVDPQKDKLVQVTKFQTYQIISIYQPEPGIWAYALNGKGRIEVYENAIPLKINLIEPAVTQPLGRDFNILISFLDVNGKPVQELPNFPLRFSATLLKPGQLTGNDYLLDGAGDGKYISKDRIKADRPGACELLIMANAGPDFQWQSRNMIKIVKRPRLVILKPSRGSTVSFSNNTEVELQLLEGDEPIDAAQRFETSTPNLISAEIVQVAQGNTSKAIFLDPVDKGIRGIFRGNIPFKLNLNGEFHIRAKLQGIESGSKASIKDLIEEPYIVKQSALQILIKLLLWSILIILILFVLWKLLWWIYLIRRSPIHTGCIVVNEKNEDGSYSEISRIPIDGRKYFKGKVKTSKGKNARILVAAASDIQDSTDYSIMVFTSKWLPVGKSISLEGEIDLSTDVKIKYTY